MRRRRGGDVVALGAIAAGTVISFGLTGALFVANPTAPIVRVEVERLAPRVAEEAAAVQIPNGYRALAVKVEDEVAVSGWVKPGSHVDVLVTLDGAAADVEPVTQLLLENALVLGNDRTISQGPDGEKAKAISMVTVLVTPDQAEQVTMASTHGGLHLALRNLNVVYGPDGPALADVKLKVRRVAPERR